MKNDTSLERIISYVLVGGVLASLILGLTGLVSYYLENRLCLEIPLNGQSTLLLGRFFNQAFQMNSYTLLSASILIILFTPYIRVLTSIIYFVKTRDYKFVILTSTVFITLTIILLVH
ncbi:MAG: DUF1634 domain-containing protein [Thaumarchaeota archaeon]|nr:DUF1634 domain-containing protein [Candidatus Geocrenenecus arthurdayi]MCL7391187.1 DUF1634 domain-containing protein [Candidatus Geocrenenecus arthurdayi]MCL7402101.1 DUF1634 domain-containing protein [Candidatus Geocrenenecus arthurdayi]MCL7402814.1 DUF1634 domain-containing protein [Candidatus Geocrenenecus arthurdayi]